MMVCSRCGTQGEPVTYTKGSILWELVLWFMFLLPGLMYSVWRLASRYQGCPACEAPNMIPADSPCGQALTR